MSKPHRFARLNLFVDLAMPHLTRSEIRVWLLLFRRADFRTHKCQASMVLIAKHAGLSVRATLTAIERLRRLKLLKVHTRGKWGSKTAQNMYEVGISGDWTPLPPSC